MEDTFSIACPPPQSNLEDLVVADGGENEGILDGGGNEGEIDRNECAETTISTANKS